MWEAMREFGVQEHVVQLLVEWHVGSWVYVQDEAGRVPGEFVATSKGVRQGDVVASLCFPSS
eukprot:12255363-Prorocentrum_lima.AAC.1